MTDDPVSSALPTRANAETNLRPAPVESSPAHNMFRGPNGQRAGWRLLIFFAIIFALFLVLGTVLRILHIDTMNQASAGQLTPVGLSITEGTILLFAAIAAFIMSKIERRRFSQYGLPLAGALGKNFWKGTVWGFLSVSGTLLTIFALHGFRITGFAIHGTAILASTAAWSVTMLIVGLSEEFAFRGYPQFTLASGIGFWPAAFVFSALFGAAHIGNKGETISGLLSVVVFGMLFCLFLRRTGNLWFAVGFHAGWDWGQTFFYGVPDSGLLPYHNLLNSSFTGPRWLTGGTVGPEASVFTPIALLIAAALFSWRYREVRWRGLGTPASLTD
jgi:hypothetical protein